MDSFHFVSSVFHFLLKSPLTVGHRLLWTQSLSEWGPVLQLWEWLLLQQLSWRLRRKELFAPERSLPFYSLWRYIFSQRLWTPFALQPYAWSRLLWSGKGWCRKQGKGIAWSCGRAQVAFCEPGLCSQSSPWHLPCPWICSCLQMGSPVSLF